MARNKEMPTVFALGALSYPLLELLWRGRTHASMALAGGVCFAGIYRIHAQRRPFWSRCARGALFVTGVELATGLIVNRLLRLNVWDYSKRRGNLLGQVCPLYTALWFGLCAMVSPLCARLRLYFLRQVSYNGVSYQKESFRCSRESVPCPATFPTIIRTWSPAKPSPTRRIRR